MRMPALSMPETEPTHKPRQLTNFAGLQNQVPEIGHQTEREEIHPCAFQSRREDPFECLEIGVIIKDTHPAVRRGGHNPLARSLAMSACLPPARTLSATTNGCFRTSIHRPPYPCERFYMSVARHDASVVAKVTG